MFWLVVLVALFFAPKSWTRSAAVMVRPGCQESCGGLAVPFPFGISGQAGGAGCFLPGFGVACNTTFDPPKLFLGTGNIEVLNVSIDGQLQVNQWVSRDCDYKNGTKYSNDAWMDLAEPYKVSDARNKFVAVGCDTVGYLMDFDGRFSTGCASLCASMSYVVNGTCSGIGCCETSVPKDIRAFKLTLGSYYNHSYTSSFSPCSYAFLADHSFVFNTSIFLDFELREKLPVTLEWAVGNQSCEAAKSSTVGDYYACKDEYSVCENSTDGLGYRCRCKGGYQGNAYLEGGCEACKVGFGQPFHGYKYTFCACEIWQRGGGDNLIAEAFLASELIVRGNDSTCKGSGILKN